MTTNPIRLRTLLGRHPGTAPILDGELTSDVVHLDFVDAPVPNKWFKRVVRELELEVAELAIATFLSAKAVDKPLVLLPATVLGRFQHAHLVYNAERGALQLDALAGKRIGIRAWSVTTAMWVRGILSDDFGIDPASVEWVTFEDAHVAEYSDPPFSQRASAGANMEQMLLDGELDAAVVGALPAADSPLRPLIAQPADAARDWCARNHAVPVNHLIVVRKDVAETNPQAVREVYRMLAEGRARTSSGVDGDLDLLPFGWDALAPSLEVAIRYASSHGMLARNLTVAELAAETDAFL